MKNLLSFLFLESAADAATISDVDIAENLEALFEDAEKLEKGSLESKKTPLSKALEEFGVSGSDLQLDTEGLCLVTDDPAYYRDIVSVLNSPDAMHKLATMGWVVTKPGDSAMTSEPAEYKVRFLEISTVSTGDDDKPDEKVKEIAKKAREFATEPMDRDDENNPVENEDGDMGKNQTGVGKVKDGSAPEGTPKGSKKTDESLQEMTGTGSMGTVEGPQGVIAPGLVKKPKPYGKGTKFAMPRQWKVKQPVVDKQVKENTESLSPEESAEEFLKENIVQNPKKQMKSSKDISK